MGRKLLIKQRVFSWTDSYDVYDEWENPKYYVEAEFFTLGHQLHVYEKSTKREVGAVKQQILTFLPRFEIEIDGQSVGVIQKELSFLIPKYKVDVNGWKVEGDFLGWDYKVMSGSSVVMRISREPFHWGDTYVIEFTDHADMCDEKNELMGLLLVVAIDAANCSNGG